MEILSVEWIKLVAFCLACAIRSKIYRDRERGKKRRESAVIHHIYQKKNKYIQGVSWHKREGVLSSFFSSLASSFVVVGTKSSCFLVRAEKHTHTLNAYIMLESNP